MSDPIEQFDQPATIPPRELNPLLNPLLAKNMGRWAEVYFTALPEKREQAVADLLLELGAQESAQTVRETTQGPVTAPSPEPGSDASGRISAEIEVVCPSCGHDNPPAQKFCGMCGAALRGEVGAASEPMVPDGLRFLPPENIPAETAVDEHPGERSGNNGDQPATPQPNEYSSYAQEVGFRDDAFLLDSARPSFASSYRMFIGTALAIVIVVLAYMAWRSGQAASQLSQQAPRASTVQPTTSTAIASPSEPASEEPADPVANSTVKDAAPAPVPNSAKVRKENDPMRDPGRPSPRPATLVEKGPDLSPRGNGAEELAIAQRYLNGGDGQARDAAEAAQWLWKAVAKRNGEATMLLSDLYLRGTGIQKNCDQARVLLRAAAQNGRKDAAERLLHMQAFGCE